MSVTICRFPMVSENWAVRYRELTNAGLIVLGSDAKEKIESLSSILPILEAARSSDVKLLDSKTIDDLLTLVPNNINNLPININDNADSIHSLRKE